MSRRAGVTGHGCRHGTTTVRYAAMISGPARVIRQPQPQATVRCVPRRRARRRNYHHEYNEGREFGPAGTVE
eukprot:764551-Hanusia_phi.AAC.2